MKFIDYPNLMKFDGRVLNKEKYIELYESIKELYMEDKMEKARSTQIRGPQEQEDNGFCCGAGAKDGGWGA